MQRKSIYFPYVQLKKTSASYVVMETYVTIVNIEVYATILLCVTINDLFIYLDETWNAEVWSTYYDWIGI